MDGHRAREVTLESKALAPVRRREPLPVPGWLAAVVGVGWPLVVMLMPALAAAPADPEAVPSLLDAAVFAAVVVGLAGTVAAALARHARALMWSTGLGLVWVATTITCPLSGHHDTLGWQWQVDLASSGSLLLISLIGARWLRSR